MKDPFLPLTAILAQRLGQVNEKYRNYPGFISYTQVSDQYAPFHTKVINATVRDATQCA